jgi:hypothetical protein
MKLGTRLFGCGKFKWLCIERFDRDLSEKENRFYRMHRDVCFVCLRYEQQATNAMNLVGCAAIEPEISPTFNEDVVLKFRAQRKRAALTYWSPALAGAAVAGVVLATALQIITRSSELPQFNNPRGEARLTISGQDQYRLPELVLKNLHR